MHASSHPFCAMTQDRRKSPYPPLDGAMESQWHLHLGICILILDGAWSSCRLNTTLNPFKKKPQILKAIAPAGRAAELTSGAAPLGRKMPAAHQQPAQANGEVPAVSPVEPPDPCIPPTGCQQPTHAAMTGDAAPDALGRDHPALDDAAAPAEERLPADGDTGPACGTFTELPAGSGGLEGSCPARSKLVPLNGRASGPASGRSLGLGRKPGMAQTPARLGVPGSGAPDDTSRPSSHLQTPKTAVLAGDGAAGDGAVKRLAGMKAGLHGGISGGSSVAKAQLGGIMGSGTPIYRVSGLRRSSGPRLHANLVRNP